MNKEAFKKRMQSLKSYRELNPDKGYWDWKVLAFGGGGEVTVTKEEYIASQIEKKKAKALNRSRTRQYPRVPTTGGRKSEEEWRKGLTTQILEQLNLARRPFLTEMSRNMYRINAKSLQYRLDQGYNEYIGEGKILGPSCAYTTSDNYDMDFIGSELFRQNAADYGFKEIPYEQVQPGDIVLDTKTGKATHTMMYDGKDAQGTARFNHSNGGHTKEAIRKSARYPFKNGDPLAYTYVGTSADSTRWANEYKLLYENKIPSYEEQNSNNLPSLEGEFDPYNPTPEQREKINLATGKTAEGYPLELGLELVYPEAMFIPTKGIQGAIAAPQIGKNLGISFGKKAAAKLLRGSRAIENINDRVESLYGKALRAIRNPIRERLPQYKKAVTSIFDKIYSFTTNKATKDILYPDAINDAVNGNEQVQSFAYGGNTNTSSNEDREYILGNAVLHAIKKGEMDAAASLMQRTTEEYIPPVYPDSGRLEPAFSLYDLPIFGDLLSWTEAVKSIFSGDKTGAALHVLDGVNPFGAPAKNLMNYSKYGIKKKYHQQLNEIISQARKNGTKIEGDELEWALTQLPTYKKFAGQDPHVGYTGVRNPLNPEDPSQLWVGSRDRAMSYTPNKTQVTKEGLTGVLKTVSPKSTNEYNIDANGNHWTKVDGYNSTDEIAKKNNADVTIFENVRDDGPFTMRDVAESQYTIKRGYPRKAILGNNGDFDPNNKNIFKIGEIAKSGKTVAQLALEHKERKRKQEEKKNNKKSN